MSYQPSEFEMSFYLEEHGWKNVLRATKSVWTHATLVYDWPLAEAYRLQRAANKGARGLLFNVLRDWRHQRKQQTQGSR